MKEQNQKRIKPQENPIRTREAALELCLAFPGTFREQPYHDPNWDAVGLARKRKFFAFVFQKDGQIWINLKMDPEWRDLWRDAYPSVLPAYHMNKELWSSVILDGSVPNGELRKMAAGSYELVAGIKKSRKFSAFAANVYRAVRNIPAGRVATYGQIAALTGQPGAARAVGSLMRNCPRELECPCYRVISGSGKLAPAGTFGKPGTQERLLEAEGIPVKNHKVDLEKWRM